MVDAGGNTLTALNTGTITASAAGLNAVSATASISAGVATFSGLKFTGSAQSTTASFTDGTFTVTNPFTLGAGAAAAFNFVTSPSATAAYGVALGTQPVVKVVDGSGNTVTTYSGTVTVTATGLTPASGTATFVSGVATFSGLAFTGAATNYTLSFSDGNFTVATAANAFSLTPGSAANVVFATSPSAAANNAVSLATQPVVNVVDGGGNILTGLNTGSVTVSATGLTPANGSATIINGVATFSNLSFTGTATNYTLSFSDGNGHAVTSSFALGIGAASAIALTTSPSASAAYGAALAQQPVVAIRDAGGNTVTSVNTGSVSVSAGGLTPTAGSANFSNGVATFSGLSFTGTAGGFTLTFDDGSGHTTTSAFSLVAGAASSLAFTATPSASAAYNVALATQPIVRVVDAGGNTLTALNTGSITVSATGLTASTATASILNGVATFTTLSFTGVATGYTLSFSDGTRSVTNGFTLTPGAAAGLSLTTAPSASAQYDVVLAQQPVVAVVDAGGNTLTALNTGSISVSATGLTATSGSASIANGVATFSNLKFTGVATGYTLTFDDGNSHTTTSGFTLTPGVAASITINVQPSVSSPGGLSGNLLNVQPEITVLDAGGNAVGAGVNVSVTIDLPSSTGAGSLTGTTTIATNANGKVITWSLTLVPTATAETYVLKFVAGAAAQLTGTITIP